MSSLHVRPHARQRLEAERDEEVVLRQRPGAVEVALRPADALREADLRRQDLERLEAVFARRGIEPVLVRIDEHQRAAHVGVMRPGDERDLARAGDRLRLVSRR